MTTDTGNADCFTADGKMHTYDNADCLLFLSMVHKDFKKEYVLCAAIKRKTPINVVSQNYKTGTLDNDDIYSIEIGRRHNDILARFGKDVLCVIQQGFYTSFGRFVSREEALQIAKEAGQVGETDDSRLYSEDLY